MNNNNLVSEIEALRLITLIVRTQRLKLFRLLIIIVLVGTLFFMHFILALPLKIAPYLLLAAIGLSYNAIFYLLERYLKITSPYWIQIFAGVRVLLDVALLSIILYLNGGAFSPMVYFVILTVIGCTLTTGNITISLLMAFFASFFYSLALVLPYYQILPPQPEIISPFDPRYTIVQIVALSEVLLILSLMVSFVINLLRTRKNEALVTQKKLELTNSQLPQKIKELQRMNNFMRGRTSDLFELKKNVNSLLNKLGRPAKYQT